MERLCAISGADGKELHSYLSKSSGGGSHDLLAEIQSDEVSLLICDCG
jgi:hypothetical protein